MTGGVAYRVSEAVEYRATSKECNAVVNMQRIQESGVAGEAGTTEFRAAGKADYRVAKKMMGEIGGWGEL